MVTVEVTGIAELFELGDTREMVLKWQTTGWSYLSWVC